MLLYATDQRPRWCPGKARWESPQSSYVIHVFRSPAQTRTGETSINFARNSPVMSWNTPRKPQNINVLDSKFEKSVGELHATLWGTLPDPVAVEKNLRVLIWCPDLRVAWLIRGSACRLDVACVGSAACARGSVPWVGCRYMDRLPPHGQVIRLRIA